MSSKTLLVVGEGKGWRERSRAFTDFFMQSVTPVETTNQREKIVRTRSQFYAPLVPQDKKPKPRAPGSGVGSRLLTRQFTMPQISKFMPKKLAAPSVSVEQSTRTVIGRAASYPFR